MRAHVRSINGVGDLVGPISYTVPNNPFTAAKGLGDLVGPVYYSVPNNPFLGKGMAGVGCSDGCGCGPCRGGMGAIDFSLTGDGIATSLGTTLGITSMPAIPNWVLYAGAIAIAYGIYSSTGGRRRR